MVDVRMGFVAGGGLLVGPRPGLKSSCCSRRVGAVPVRAVLGQGSGLRLGLKDVDDKVVTAIESLGERRLTVADVASRAGVGVDEAQKELLILSQLTGGKLEVSNEGDIIYTFGSNVRKALRRASSRAAFREKMEKIWPVLFYLIRIGFGAFLFISIAIVFSAISIITSSSNDRDSRSDRRDYGNYYGSGPGIRLFSPSMFDIFYWSNFRATYYEPRLPKNEMGFLESIFSFVFGDGDPNRGLEEKKWRAVAATIRANDGAVTAEQLAPLLDLPVDVNLSSSDINVDESYVIPALLRFKGRPEVADEGEIIYVFPEMTKSGSNVDMVGDPRGRYVEEDEWAFSRANTGQKILAGGLGAVNFMGVLTLGGLLTNPAALRGTSPAFIASIQGLFPLLFVYGVSYAAVPLFRWFLNRRRNGRIRIRNELRQAAANLLLKPDARLRRKEAAARRRALERNVITEKDVSFSSDKDITPPEEDLLGDFDRKLSDSGRKF